jgi:O-antigen/teichoic acid export membrane protein
VAHLNSVAPASGTVVSSIHPTVSTPAEAHSPRPSLKDRFVRAGSWTVAAYGGTLCLRLASSLVMTRLLAPEAFGLMAIVMTIGIVAALLSDIGIRQAVVHSAHGDDPRMLDTAWTMQIVRGLLIWGSCCLIALGLYVARLGGWLTGDSIYASPLLPPLLALGTATSLITGFESTKRYTADRRIEQKRVVLIELGAMFVGISTMIVIGAFTGSVWSIVIGSFITSGCSVLLGHLWLDGRANRLHWDRAYARQIFSYGKWIFLSSLMYVLAVQGDKLLLGGWLTPAALGCYAIGQNLAQILEHAVGRVFTQVAAPAFGDVVRSSPERLREVYLRLRLPFDLIFVTSAGLLFAVGPWLVGLMYDPRYAEAGAILQVLSCALLFARYGASTSAYLALQAPHAQAVINVVRMVSFFTVVPLAYSAFGIQGAYWAIALHAAAIMPVVWHYDRRFGLLSWRHEVLTLCAWPAGWAVGTAFVAAATALVQAWR